VVRSIRHANVVAILVLYFVCTMRWISKHFQYLDVNFEPKTRRKLMPLLRSE
jgi:hypothetical protein